MQALSTAFCICILASSASGATLVMEDFDDEAANFGSVLNFDSYSTFQQNIGVTDLISHGGFGISCAGGSGGCVDLDGSTAGTDPTSLLEVFFAGAVGSYTINFDLAGNQRVDGNDTVTAAYFVGDAQNLGTNYVLDRNDPFQTFVMSFDVTIAGQGHFQIGQSGPSDNFGAILDNVKISYEPSVVPIPAAGLLLLSALGGLAGWRRRRA